MKQIVFSAKWGKFMDCQTNDSICLMNKNFSLIQDSLGNQEESYKKEKWINHYIKILDIDNKEVLKLKSSSKFMVALFKSITTLRLKNNFYFTINKIEYNKLIIFEPSLVIDFKNLNEYSEFKKYFSIIFKRYSTRVLGINNLIKWKKQHESIS